MGSPIDERRRYARHPIHVPLAVRPADGSAQFTATMGDLSEAGLSFTSPHAISAGAGVEIDLPVYDRRFTLEGSVASCIESTDRAAFRVGLAFTAPGPSFRLKVAEQMLRIKQLRRDLARERGCDVSLEEASQRWVDQYAALFSDLYLTN